MQKSFAAALQKQQEHARNEWAQKKIANLTTDRKQDFKVKNAIELDVLEQNL